MKKFLTKIFILLISFIFILNIYPVEAKSPKASSKQEIHQLYKQATKAFKKNDIQKAKDLFYKILELYPKHKSANKYIDYEIPKKISKLKIKQIKDRSGVQEVTKNTKQDRLKEARQKKAQKILEVKEKNERIRSLKQNKKGIRLKQKEERKAASRERKGMSRNKLKENKERIHSLRENGRERRLEKKRKKIEEIETRREETQEIKEQKRKNKILTRQEKIKDAQQRKQDLGDGREKKRSANLEAKKINASESKIKTRENYRKKNIPALERLHKNSITSEQKGKKAYINALYNEGFFAYKIGEFDKAKEAFEKILKIDATEIKARDYLNIYIPKEERKIRKEQDIQE